MKLSEYAEARKIPEEEVKKALAATGQTTHPNSNIDEAKLDKYFKNGKLGQEEDAPGDEVEAPKPKKQEKKSSGKKQKTVVTTDNDDVVHVVVEDVAPAEQAPTRIFGEYETGMKVYVLKPSGKAATGAVYQAYGHDSSQAIGAIVSGIPAFRHNLLNWTVIKVKSVVEKRV